VTMLFHMTDSCYKFLWKCSTW